MEIRDELSLRYFDEPTPVAVLDSWRVDPFRGINMHPLCIVRDKKMFDHHNSPS